MAAVMPSLATPPAAQRLLLSGNEAVARGVWEAGTRVAAAYPGTPATEILETLSRFPDLHAEWSVNEKVSMEVALGASMTGARAFCAMKHVGLIVANSGSSSKCGAVTTRSCIRDCCVCCTCSSRTRMNW